ncbi:NADP-dependent 3-hydroxy acid dehydrogenase YdfG [Spinactinospora alkalitolerans]|uniref:NADP-dependent 3-hydroxy acid dehydrogenase YdfG n=1 Tax=Spinactinospora alkalitolerans TaxID=687207 RepID=A0A852U372_9ACTN|nr:SDR family NAD(P)-dependent oxidoreductase [Spinactinospora alkalitolerans]NYE50621.1 NADP-dependent 3-hydroxy acid dehydrogenase YdfG [Spinactinospora alkalitolerans]
MTDTTEETAAPEVADGVVVTGAAGGIGSAVVGALAGRGRRVLAMGRDSERLAAIAEAHPGVRPVPADLRRPESLADAVTGIAGLDALVHCAGVAPVASVAASTVELWRETLTVNLAAAAACGPALLESPPAHGQRSGGVRARLSRGGSAPAGRARA